MIDDEIEKNHDMVCLVHPPSSPSNKDLAFSVRDGDMDSKVIVPAHPVHPRPLLHRRVNSHQRKDDSDSDDLLSISKAQIVQDGIRRGEEHGRRGQERRDREDERLTERERRIEDARRHDQLMQVMMLMITKGSIVDKSHS